MLRALSVNGSCAREVGEGMQGCGRRDSSSGARTRRERSKSRRTKDSNMRVCVNSSNFKIHVTHERLEYESVHQQQQHRDSCLWGETSPSNWFLSSRSTSANDILETRSNFPASCEQTTNTNNDARGTESSATARSIQKILHPDNTRSSARIFSRAPLPLFCRASSCNFSRTFLPAPHRRERLLPLQIPAATWPSSPLPCPCLPPPAPSCAQNPQCMLD